MKSAFPGMDPYIERYWFELQMGLVVGASREINRQLGDDIVSRINSRVITDDALISPRRTGPSIRAIELTPSEHQEMLSGVAVAVTKKPVHLTEVSEPITERFLEIIDLSTGGRVITVIEFVSPSNKHPGDGMKQYRQKQEECYNTKVSLVEIDLTRGDRTLLAHRWSTARQYESTYQISIWRATQPMGIDLYPISLREPLPIVPIPLRPGEKEAILDLQSILADCYADARYDRTIDYHKSLEPSLDPADAAWVNGVIADKK